MNVERYEGKRPDPTLERWLAEYSSEISNLGGVILELGSGPGRNTVAFAQYQFNAINCIELDKVAAERCRINTNPMSNVIVIEGSWLTLPMENTIISAIFSINTWHLMENNEMIVSAWKEAVRVLRKDGLLFVRVPSDRFLFQKKNHHQYSEKEIKKLADDNNLIILNKNHRIRDKENVRQGRWELVFKKKI